MGIAPVGNKKYFTFDGETSKKYNTHITGQGVFNAPVRAVEMVNIPNRNGAFALDQGYFENVELTYEASIAADSVAEFSQAVSDLRNWLCSKKGYCRLEDDYNPNEYRMAVYKSGLEVEPFLASTGKFDIVFDCKPQRFLTSGESAISVTSGDTITNPTRFDAKPLLQVWGYGKINIGGNNAINVIQADVGNVVIFTETGQSLQNADYYPVFEMLGSGDSFDLNGSFGFGFTSYAHPYDSTGVGTSTNCNNKQLYMTGSQYNTMVGIADFDTLSCTKGIDASITATWTPTYTINGTTYTPTISAVLAYDSSAGNVSITISVSGSYGSVSRSYSSKLYEISAYSTRQATGSPLYIDFDIGEAWNEDSGTPVSSNSAVITPAELPTLVSGANTITYDNTFTSFKVVPRWWRV